MKYRPLTPYNETTMHKILTSFLLMTAISCGEKDSDTGTTEETTEETTKEETTADTSTEETTTEEASDVCELPNLERVVHALPSTQEEAAQLTLVPGAGESYTLEKTAEAEGWFALEVPSWMCDVQLYTTEGVSIELQASSDYELGEVGTPVGECEENGMIVYTWTFHAWGSYIAHVQAPEQTEVWLGSVLLE